MFPAVHTLWLLLVVIALNVLGTFVTLVQELRELRLLCREKGVWVSVIWMNRRLRQEG